MEDSRPPPEHPPGPISPEEARRRLEQVAEAAAAFAHDLKNPLSALLLGVQRLGRLAEPERQAQARELVARLERSVQAMSRLVDGHAGFGRLQAGQLALERSRRPCAELLLEALAPLRPMAAERRQALDVDAPATLPEVEWDVPRIAEALDLVVGAALRLAPEGVAVSCTAAASGGEVTITVVVALPAPAGPAAAIFLPPGAPSAPRRIRGSALIVARGLIEAHGGRVELEDDPERTSLRMTLPAAPPPAR